LCTQKPKELKNRKGLYCVKAPDDFCFKYSVLCGLHFEGIPRKSRTSWKSYIKFARLYDFSALAFPVDPFKIDEFEVASQVTVQIFTHDGSKVYPLRISSRRYDKNVHLLYIGDKLKGHYITIHDLNLFMGTAGVRRHYWCYYCLNKYTSNEKCQEHMNDCKGYGTQVVKLMKPLPDGSPPYLEFTDYRKTLPMQYVAYADLETAIISLSEKEKNELTSGSGTHYQKLLVGAYSWWVLQRRLEVCNIIIT